MKIYLPSTFTDQVLLLYCAHRRLITQRTRRYVCSVPKRGHQSIRYYLLTFPLRLARALKASPCCTWLYQDKKPSRVEVAMPSVCLRPTACTVHLGIPASCLGGLSTGGNDPLAV